MSDVLMQKPSDRSISNKIDASNRRCECATAMFHHLASESVSVHESKPGEDRDRYFCFQKLHARNCTHCRKPMLGADNELQEVTIEEHN